MKEEKRSSSLNKESEKKSTKMKKSNSKKNSSSSATTTATSVDFPAQSLSFKTPSQTGAAKNDESSPPPPPSSSEILDGYKAPKNTPAETTEVPMNTNDDENALTETIARELINHDVLGRYMNEIARFAYIRKTSHSGAASRRARTTSAGGTLAPTWRTTRRTESLPEEGVEKEDVGVNSGTLTRRHVADHVVE